MKRQPRKMKRQPRKRAAPSPEPAKVWIIHRDLIPEFSEIYGVYGSREAAEKYLGIVEKKWGQWNEKPGVAQRHPWDPEEWTIEEYAVTVLGPNDEIRTPGDR